jgi:branched-chain amino acid transport system substrate-binding protein
VPGPGPGGAQPPSGGGGGGGGVATPGAPSPGASGVKSPIKVGSVAALSGPAGEAYTAIMRGEQVWGSWINRRNGVNGHRVQLILVDDAGDPARHKAAIKDLVEVQKVIALVNVLGGTVGPVAKEYVESKRMPVIGDEGGGDWSYESPMYFPQMSVGDESIKIHFANFGQALKAKNKSKIAILACVEAQICKSHYDKGPGLAPKYGMQVVYRAQVSLTQPDFTAECLSAAKAGAEGIFGVMDQNGMRRVVTSCSRQSLKYSYSMHASGMSSYFIEDPNFNNSYTAALATFPWFQSNTPATAEFQEAFKEAKVPVDYQPTLGWVSAKIFEKAAANLPEPPTTEAVLEGLWSIKNDDLGGLTHPLTFTKGEHAPRVACWMDAAIVDGKWTSSYKRTCTDP